MFLKAHEENSKQAELEKKKAEKEAEMEKAKGINLIRKSGKYEGEESGERGWRKRLGHSLDEEEQR